MNSALLSTFPVPLSEPMFQRAEQLSQQQSYPEKVRQIYFNTLAVLATDFYCQCLEIETVSHGSESLDSVQQALLDVADLEIKDIGKLECRPVLVGDEQCKIPPEVWSDRIGFVAVHIDINQQQARLLGFLPVVTRESIALKEFQPLEELLTVLDHLMVTSGVELVPPVSEIAQQTVNHLSQWFHDLVETGWQALEFEELVLATAWRGKDDNLREHISDQLHQETDQATSLPEKGLRKIPKDGIAYWQPLDLSTSHQSLGIKLNVGIAPYKQSEHEIWVVLRPGENQICLPPGLEVQILDNLKLPVMQAQARDAEGLRLNFRGKPGETFSVRVSLQDRDEVRLFLI